MSVEISSEFPNKCRRNTCVSLCQLSLLSGTAACTITHLMHVYIHAHLACFSAATMSSVLILSRGRAVSASNIFPPLPATATALLPATAATGAARTAGGGCAGCTGAGLGICATHADCVSFTWALHVCVAYISKSMVRKKTNGASRYET